MVAARTPVAFCAHHVMEVPLLGLFNVAGAKEQTWTHGHAQPAHDTRC